MVPPSLALVLEIITDIEWPDIKFPFRNKYQASFLKAPLGKPPAVCVSCAIKEQQNSFRRIFEDLPEPDLLSSKPHTKPHICAMNSQLFKLSIQFQRLYFISQLLWEAQKESGRAELMF